MVVGAGGGKVAQLTVLLPTPGCGATDQAVAKPGDPKTDDCCGSE